MKRALTIFTIVLISLTFIPFVLCQANTDLPVTDSGFKPVELALKGKTNVPIVIPASFPEGKVSYDFYGNISMPNRSLYEIIIGFDPYCSGGNSCRIGSLYGKFNRRKQIIGTPNHPFQKKKAQPVKLHRGIVGYFVKYTFGASFSDSSIYWKQGKFEYMVGLKGAEKKEMIRFANSAIKNSFKIVPF